MLPDLTESAIKSASYQNADVTSRIELPRMINNHILGANGYHPIVLCREYSSEWDELYNEQAFRENGLR